MMIVNADDWGGTSAETDAALRCYESGRISSVTAMVYMQDSVRAAEIANGISMDVGLHLNLTQIFTGIQGNGLLKEYHCQVVRFLARSKYSRLIYNPALRKQFKYVYEAQVEEFLRLYGRPPSHIDGHHHQHLCANILLDNVIPFGERVRRNFSFWPAEKMILNRAYRRASDAWLSRRYLLTDYFFSLSHCLQNDTITRVADVARRSSVEIMTHPIKGEEYSYLMSDSYIDAFRHVELSMFGEVNQVSCADPQ
jgi:predicted glycoside hydrolase/deacetylase ChbG (UPF0249 family)